MGEGGVRVCVGVCVWGRSLGCFGSPRKERVKFVNVVIITVQNLRTFLKMTKFRDDKGSHRPAPGCMSNYYKPGFPAIAYLP